MLLQSNCQCQTKEVYFRYINFVMHEATSEA
jgi:hypothetical protein